MPSLDPTEPGIPGDHGDASPDVVLERRTHHPDGRRSWFRLSLRTRGIVVGLVLLVGSGGADVPPRNEADPRFGTCKEAKSHGYGPYREGEDPEYDWYRDADNDGIVCE